MAKLPAYLRRDIRLLDVHSHSGFEPLLYLTHGFPFCQSLRNSFEDNERSGITHAVVFPLCTSLYYDLPAMQRGKIKLERRIGTAPFAFENEHLLRQIYEIFPDYKRMFMPFMMLDTAREAKKQVRALSSLLDRFRFYGLKVHPRTTQAAVSTLGGPGRPLLDFARANDLPILFHSAYPGSPDRLSQISQILDLARAYPGLRFCAAHFCGFHQKTFEEAARYDNVWVDSGAMSIGCDVVVQKLKIYEAGPAKIPGDYRDPPGRVRRNRPAFSGHVHVGNRQPGAHLGQQLPGQARGQAAAGRALEFHGSREKAAARRLGGLAPQGGLRERPGFPRGLGRRSAPVSEKPRHWHSPDPKGAQAGAVGDSDRVGEQGRVAGEVDRDVGEGPRGIPLQESPQGPGPASVGGHGGHERSPSAVRVAVARKRKEPRVVVVDGEK